MMSELLLDEGLVGDGARRASEPDHATGRNDECKPDSSRLLHDRRARDPFAGNGLRHGGPPIQEGNSWSR